MQITSNQKYKDLSVNANPEHGHALYTDILDGIYRQLKNLQTHHSRIDVIRLDISLPKKDKYDPKEENKQIRAFFKSLKENLGLVRWGRHKRVAHGWVREVGKTDHGHYHLYIAFKRFTLSHGTFSRSGYTGLWSLLQNCAKRTIGGRMHIVPVVHQIDRDDHQGFQKCFYHLSYLAKVRTKELFSGNGHKSFDFSRIKPNEKA